MKLFYLISWLFTTDQNGVDITLLMTSTKFEILSVIVIGFDITYISSVLTVIIRSREALLKLLACSSDPFLSAAV